MSRENQAVRSEFFHYVSLNVIGMIGVSAYILADTFFISKAQGSNGITALNLILPIYSLIFAIGAMIGIGAATRFSILRAQGRNEADLYYTNSMEWAVIAAIPFILIGLLMPEQLIRLLGGNEDIVRIGVPYTRIFMCFAPLFIWDKITNAFVRNDGAPGIAMAATFSSSVFNILFDYILMFPLGMGMAGAALATALSPAVGLLICIFGHLARSGSTVRLVRTLPNIKRLATSCMLGISAFIGEIASGITTMVFNFLILRLAGNDGVAAYGVIANTALVATALFNGIAQGSQPITSRAYGSGKKSELSEILKLGMLTSIVSAVFILLLAQLFPNELTAVFNSEHNAAMASYAVSGIRIYFAGYLFAGINIVGTGYLSAVDRAVPSFIASILRGAVAIIVCGFVLSALFGMTGIWMAFPAAEAITAVVTVWFLLR